MTKAEMSEVPFERRAELFKKAVERAAKRFMVEFDCCYIWSYHDTHVTIIDKLDDDNMVYYNTIDTRGVKYDRI